MDHALNLSKFDLVHEAIAQALRDAGAAITDRCQQQRQAYHQQNLTTARREQARSSKRGRWQRPGRTALTDAWARLTGQTEP